MEPYFYSPLDNDQIRILTVLPSSDPPAIKLETRPLDDLPAYRALSYTWGSESDDSYNVRCNDSYITVFSNLYAVLQRFSAERQELFLWIDAICINQANPKEKEKQIPLMRDIYSNAESVLVWLGLADAEEEGNLSKATKIGMQLRTCGFPANTRKENREIAVAVLQSLSNYSPRIYAQIMSREWFARVWVVQEVYLGREVQVLLGLTTTVSFDNLILWSRLHITVSDVSEYFGSALYKEMHLISPDSAKRLDNFCLAHSRDSYGLSRFQALMELCMDHTVLLITLGRFHEVRAQSLHRVLGAYAKRRVSFDVDRVYGMLGVLPIALCKDIAVAEDGTIEDLYSQASEFWILNSRSVESLNWVDPSAGPSSLPSWCLDLRCCSPQIKICVRSDEGREGVGHYAGAVPDKLFGDQFSRAYATHFSQPRALNIGGFLLATIGKMVRPDLSKGPLVNTKIGMQAICEWNDLCLQLATDTLASRLIAIDAHIRTLMLDWEAKPASTKEAINASSYLSLMEKVRSLDPEQLISSPSPLSSAEGYLLDSFNIEKGALSHFSTKNGYFGRCYNVCCPGDQVVIFPNASTPFILRQHSEDGWTFLGEAYVHGIMQGEFLKDKPDDHSPQWFHIT